MEDHIITDSDIENKSINEIENLKKDKQNKFKITNDSLNNSFKENNIQKMKYLKDFFNLKLQGNGYFHVDVSIEEGNEKMAKFLVQEFGAQPSLYAKQMAHVNGHSNLSFWMDKYAQQRNNIGIDSVHKRFDGSKSGMGWFWSESIPEKFRY